MIKQHSYRQIFKATSLFGGVQIFNIAISIIRSKFIAVLLGPAGMGISGLLTSTTGFISSLTNFGLGTSAVKNVAAASTTGDNNRVNFIASVLTRLVWITGILGLIITIVLSPWLSQITFGNKDYTIAFMWISITLLFQQITSGKMVILQGLRKLEYLAKANLVGSVIGLFITIPLYYIWRFDGIVPAIIVTSLASMVLSWFYSRKTGIKIISVPVKKTFSEGREMVVMGFMLSLSGLMTLGLSYFVRIYVSNTGGLEQVGLFSAGFTLINTYFGMVFNSMCTDYYPRLSGMANDNMKARELINQQAEVAILILAPMLAIFLIFINWMIILLYSGKFLEIDGMIHWAVLGIYFKAASWAIGFLLLAKGASKIFFINELLANAYLLLFNILGYKYLGLEGLGISFLAGYILYLVQVFFITKVKYQFSFDKVFYKIAGIQFLIGVMCFGIVTILSAPWTYILGSILISISLVYSLKELEKRIGLYSIIKSKLKSYKPYE